MFCWPNVQWTRGYAQIYLERGWTGFSDAQGVALIENLPASATTSFSALHVDYRMSGGGSLELVAGATLERTITLERRPD